MPEFKDKSGQTWAVELPIGIARRTFDLGRPETLSDLIDDAYARFDLLWMLCETQATARSITQQQFEDLVADDSAYAEANAALLQAIEDFFRRIGKASLALLISKTREAALRLEQQAQQKVEQSVPTVLDGVVKHSLLKMDEAIARAAGQSSGSSPA